MKNFTGIVVVIIGLLLFVILSRKKKKQSMYDNFFSDAEIVKDFEEAAIPTAVPAAMMDAQEDSGNKGTECEEGGYMSFTFPNPTPNPITLNIVDPQQYYQTLNSFYSSQINTSTTYNIGGILTSSLYINNLIYGLDRTSGAGQVRVFDPETNVSVVNISILPNEIDIVGANGNNSIVYNNLLIVPGFRYASIIDVNPSSVTYNQLIANVDCGVGNVLNTCSVFGSFVYVTCSGTQKGLKKISLSTFLVVSTFNGAAADISSSFPNFAISQTTNRFIYLFEKTTTTFIVYDTLTDTISSTGAMTVQNSLQPCLVGTDLYIPQNNNIDIFSTISNSVTDNITVTGKSILEIVFNSENTIYCTTNASSVEAIDINSNTIITSISTAAFISTGADSMIISAGILYVGGSSFNGTFISIDTNESDITYNTITSHISTGLSSPLIHPIIVLNGSKTNIYFTSLNNHFITNSLVANNVTVITDQISINLNNMHNMQANPGMICGIFYRSLTVAQMSNVFSIDFNNALGVLNSYKLIPITYKDTMSMLNQIYVSQFHQPLIINNNLNLYHVINPGENVYVKIYVKNYVSNVDLLNTGEINVSETKDSSVFKGGDTEQEESEEDQESQDDEEGWMTVEEVEAGEWDIIHIQCEEESEDKEE